ncbi:MAG: DcrB-related protein [Gibbsiella quercinecans]|uniref:DcrB-related protein n=1 Tax=Gibbsiella quercinecans TaxID=929813 RepID=UPI003F3D7727
MDNYFCCFNEGRVRLPAGYIDRTINIIADRLSQLPPVNISRDLMGSAADLNGYIEGQLNLLKPKVSGWQEDPRREVVLGNSVNHGIEIAYSFLRPDNQRVWQLQAIFTFNHRDVIIFSSSKGSAFNEKDRQRFHLLLKSFIPAGEY